MNLRLPSEDKQLTGVSAIMKNLSNLPIGLGTNTKTADMDLYTTVLSSRPFLEQIITKFDLMKDYKLVSMEKAVKTLRKQIKGKVNDESAYEITVRAGSAQKAADITNYVLEVLNKTIVELNVAKSRNNRIFLEDRYNEMTANLRLAEDSLQYYQEKTGMFEAKEQVKLIITTYSTIEAELISKQIELSILENTLSKESPQLETLRMQVKEYAQKLDEMKKGGQSNGIILGLESLPLAAKQYIRHFRDVEIYSKILEFLIPMYEQARFDEQKNVPVVQVVEYPVPAEKKAYPPRMIFSLIITFGGLLITFFYVLMNENDNWKKDEKIIFIRENIKKWKRSR
jgi:capsule polysaccharide export protein KpsE/RkpR